MKDKIKPYWAEPATLATQKIWILSGLMLLPSHPVHALHFSAVNRPPRASRRTLVVGPLASCLNGEHSGCESENPHLTCRFTFSPFIGVLSPDFKGWKHSFLFQSWSLKILSFLPFSRIYLPLASVFPRGAILPFRGQVASLIICVLWRLSLLLLP